MPTKPQETANSSPANIEIRCTVTKVMHAEPFAQLTIGETSEEPCVVLKLPGDDRDVSARIGSSPERPTTPPQREDAVLLLRATTKADINDLIEVAGLRLKVVATSPSYDAVGKLAHHVVQAVICEARPEKIGGA